MSNIILEVRNIIKDFPGTRALNDVDFNLVKGEVHAVIGENGAGKSTLMKIICGDYIKTSGTIFIDRKETDIKSPSDSLGLGIRMIYQELENYHYIFRYCLLDFEKYQHLKVDKYYYNLNQILEVVQLL